jgi:hypothetical protein
VQVDDEDVGSEADAEDLELRDALGGQTQAAAPPGGSSSVAGGKGKSVRMSVAGGACTTCGVHCTMYCCLKVHIVLCCVFWPL